MCSTCQSLAVTTMWSAESDDHAGGDGFLKNSPNVRGFSTDRTNFDSVQVWLYTNPSHPATTLDYRIQYVYGKRRRCAPRWSGSPRSRLTTISWTRLRRSTAFSGRKS